MKRLLVGLLCGALVFAALFVGYRVANRHRPTKDVLVAVVPIKRFATVTGKAVKSERRSVSGAPADALSVSTEAAGQVVLTPIATDGVIRKGNLVPAAAIAHRVAITIEARVSTVPTAGTFTDVIVSPRRAGTSGKVFPSLLVLAAEKTGSTVRVTLAVKFADRAVLADMLGSSTVSLTPELKP